LAKSCKNHQKGWSNALLSNLLNLSEAIATFCQGMYDEKLYYWPLILRLYVWCTMYVHIHICPL
jgi:hypothetical protein